MLFNDKAILQEEQYWCYLTHSWEDKRVHTFPKGICPKVNVIARLEYELAYYDSVVHRFNNYTTRTPPTNTWNILTVCKQMIINWTIMRLTKAWAAIDKLSIIWKSNLTDKMKRSFFPATFVLILLYRCTIWTLRKRLEKKLDGNYTRMLRAILNKSWRQHPTKHQLYGHLPPTYGRAKAGRPARTNIHQLCEDTGCSPEDLPETMNDWEKWRERVRDIRASGTRWWWWSEYPASTAHDIQKHWTAVSTLLALITSVYRDLPHSRW